MLAYRFLFYRKIADINIDRTVVVTFFDRSPGVLVLSEEFVGVFEFGEDHIEGFTMYDLRCTIYDVRCTMYDVRCT
ncbi:MAG: hypothetical protein ACOYM0_13880, partial [Bacteroidales bacterium]